MAHCDAVGEGGIHSITKARKLDTRRKIILGGALVDLAERDSNAAAMIERLIRNLPREQDRKAFEGWDAKQPAAKPAPPAPPAGTPSKTDEAQASA